MTPAEAQRVQDDARQRDQWLIWSVEKREGRFVAYGAVPDYGGGSRIPSELVADTLDELRAMLPSGLTWHEWTTVAPGVVESWD